MLFELRGVKKRYAGKVALDLPVLDLPEGRSVVFYGPNGSGKTTLLNLLAGTDAPSEGEVLFAGGPQDVTLVEQNPYLFQTSVLGNVLQGLAYRGARAEEARRIAEPLLKRLGLWDLRDRRCAGLSDGERRRVALGRGLVLGVKALLLDEPMANLDRAYAAAVEAMIVEEAAKPGRAVLMTTHDPGQAFRMGAEVVYLSEGRLSPVPLWNVFHCELTGTLEKAVKKALLSQGAAFFVSTDTLGPAAVSIDPREVILSFKPIDSSALNCLKGRVVATAALGLDVDILIEAGCQLHAFITLQSLERMGLKPGDEVFATFKASAVKVITRLPRGEASS
ncbi:MAG: ABC transporter ATP-binding protein [Elusimicrobia bacterium]|nr:ABC transporter ATP-binding protein [Elusimicrobiota bacterium]